MTTKTVKLDPLNPDEQYIKEAAHILKSGGLVIIPTETVYGVAGDMHNPKTLARLSEIKQRPKDKPFSLHIADKNKVEEFAVDLIPLAYKLMDKFWPGPLTLIFKAKTGGTIGIRMPDNLIALEVIGKSGVTVACPSANLSGNTAPVDFSAAIKDLNGLVDFAIDGSATKLGIESTVVDLTVEPYKVLREGAIKKSEIASVAKIKNILFVCTGNSCRSVMAEAYLKKRLEESGRSDINVSSAGIILLPGIGASDGTKEVLRESGIDVSAHRSRILTADIIKRSDLILVMEHIHEDAVDSLVPNAKNRVFLLKEFAKIEDSDLNIADPIGRGIDFYEDTFAVIKEAVERMLKII